MFKIFLMSFAFLVLSNVLRKFSVWLWLKISSLALRSRAPLGLWMSSPAPHCKSLSCQVSWLIKLHMPVSFFHLANREERKLDLRIEWCSLKSPFLPQPSEVLANVSFKHSFPFCLVARSWAGLNTWQHLSNHEMIYKTGIFFIEGNISGIYIEP